MWWHQPKSRRMKLPILPKSLLADYLAHLISNICKRCNIPWHYALHESGSVEKGVWVQESSWGRHCDMSPFSWSMRRSKVAWRLTLYTLSNNRPRATTTIENHNNHKSQQKIQRARGYKRDVQKLGCLPLYDLKTPTACRCSDSSSTRPQDLRIWADVKRHSPSARATWSHAWCRCGSCIQTVQVRGEAL